MEESHEPLDIIPPPPPPPSLSQADEGPTSVDADASAPPPVPVAKKAERKERRVREPGKSLLPLARVQRIIKADRDIPMVTKEATYLVSLATEEFIKRLSEASHRIAGREKRQTVFQRDIATVVRQADEFAFLDEIVQVSTTVKRKQTTTEEKEVAPKPATLLDVYVQGTGTDMAVDSDD